MTYISLNKKNICHFVVRPGEGFGLTLHEVEKLCIVLGSFQLIEHEFDRLYLIHRV